MADAKTVLEFAKKHDAKILDLRFTDHSRAVASRLLSHRPVDGSLV